MPELSTHPAACLPIGLRGSSPKRGFLKLIGHRRGTGPMCEQCKELDAKIEHYERVARNITDQQTIDSLMKLIADRKRKRAAMHPDDGSG